MNKSLFLAGALGAFVLFGMIETSLAENHGFTQEQGQESLSREPGGSEGPGAGPGRHPRPPMTEEMKARFHEIREKCRSEGLSREECRSKYAPPHMGQNQNPYQNQGQ